MAIPFRRSQAGPSDLRCAYIELLERDSKIFGGLLVTDPKGLPKEFVYNQIAVPAGVLWPTGEVRKSAASSLSHSLFDACEQNPSLLLGGFALQESGFAPAAFAVSLPFALVDDGQLAWVGLEPAPSHPATILSSELKAQKLLEEPFSRIAKALLEVYGLSEV